MSETTVDVLNIEWTPNYKQHLAYEALETPVLDPEHLDPADPDYGPLTVEVFFGGGADGGKSWAICESRLRNALRYPGYKSFIGRHELKRLMQSTYVTWQKVCREYKIPRDEWKLDGQLHTIRFLNGSTIDLLDLSFRPTEDPLYERFGSLEYSDGAIEEAGEVHPLAREVLKTRVGRWMNDELGINPSMLETGNPKKNWTYHLFYKPASRGELPPDRFFIQALHKDNPKGERNYGKNLDRIQDPIMRARLRDGNWEYASDPAALIDYAAISDMFTNYLADDEEDQGASDRWISVDVARLGKDKTVVTVWRGWVAYKILYREKQDTRVTAEWIAEIAREEEVPYSHIVIDEDGIGGGVVDNLRGVRGFIANASPIDNRTDEEKEDEEVPDPTKVYANLKAQCGYELATKVNRHEVAARVENEQVREWLTNDLEQIKEENIDTSTESPALGEGKRKLVDKATVKIILGRSPDFGDTFLMRMVFDLKPPKEKAQTWQYRPKTPSRR